MSDSDATRYLASGILFIVALLMGTLPIYVVELVTKCLQKRKDQSPSQSFLDTSNSKSNNFSLKNLFTYERVIQFFTQLGGGVLLYTSIIHMLPEIRENYESYLKNSDNETSSNSSSTVVDKDDFWHSQPIVDLLACVGFYGMFFIEEIMHTVFHNHDHGDTQENEKEAAFQRRPTLSFRRYILPRQYSPHINESDLSISDSGIREQSPVHNGCCSESSISLPETLPISTIHKFSYHSCEQTKSCSSLDPCNVDASVFKPEVATNSEPSLGNRLFDSFMIILAFSCHSIFDGISIGVQNDSGEIWTLLIAILSHKMIIAFILSFQIYKKCCNSIVDENTGDIVKKPIKHAKLVLWLFSSLFAVMSPIGILIVIVMNNSSGEAPSETNLRIIILAAISSGTIIYIVFLEIIDKSTSRIHLSGIAQGVSLLIGFAVMHIISQTFHE